MTSASSPTTYPRSPQGRRKSPTALLLKQGRLAFSPLPDHAQLHSADIPNRVWYALGPRITAGCEEARFLALDGWEDSDGIQMECSTLGD